MKRFLILLVPMLWWVSFLSAKKPLNDRKWLPPIAVKQTPALVPADVFDTLVMYAHLTDIAYCVSGVTEIGEPFECDLDCKRFPNISVVYQWASDKDLIDSKFMVSGYLAIDHNSKEIILSLRGTHSFKDSLSDVNIEMVDYENLRYILPHCQNCKVHKGFYESFLSTLQKTNDVISNTLKKHPHEYKFSIMGHSLGGAIALFLQLHYFDLGYNPVLYTFGQPLVGNSYFTRWVDESLLSFHPIEVRNYYRVIHKGDIVTNIPSWYYLEDYDQFDNQIYISNAAGVNVRYEELWDCLTKDNLYCIKGDVAKTPSNFGNLENHLNYFRKMGGCGISAR